MSSLQQRVAGTLVGLMAVSGANADLNKSSTREALSPNPVVASLHPGETKEAVRVGSEPIIAEGALHKDTLPNETITRSRVVDPKFSVTPDQTLDVNLKQFYREILKHNRGLYLAEVHNGSELHDHYLHQMRHFASLGVKHLYLEFIRSEDQEFLDAYTKSGNERDEYLVKAAISKHGFSANSYFELVRAARKSGIEVYGIDLFTQDRIREANPHWTGVIEEHSAKLRPGEKFVVIGGQGHAGTRIREGVQSVDVNLGIPSVRLFNAYHPPHSAHEELLNSINDIPAHVLEVEQIPQVYYGSEEGHTFSLFLENHARAQVTPLTFDPTLDRSQPANAPLESELTTSFIDLSSVEQLSSIPLRPALQALFEDNRGLFLSGIFDQGEIQRELFELVDHLKDKGLKRVYFQQQNEHGVFVSDRYGPYADFMSRLNSESIEVVGLTPEALDGRQESWLHFVREDIASLEDGEKFLVICDQMLAPHITSTEFEFVAENFGIPHLEFQLFVSSPTTPLEKRFNFARQTPEEIANSVRTSTLIIDNGLKAYIPHIVRK